MSQIKRMLVPIDFSGTSDLALEYAIEMGLRYGASLHLIHVLEDPMLIGGHPDGFAIDLPDLRTRMAEDAGALLDDAKDKCIRANVPATTEVVFGKPATTIVDLPLERAYDLIVMGTHGRTGFAHLMLGSVAERVVRTAPCPVLTVREPARRRASEPVTVAKAVAQGV